jgi:hypothetical protein
MIRLKLGREDDAAHGGAVQMDPVLSRQSVR